MAEKNTETKTGGKSPMESFRLLLLEDNSVDAELVERELRKGGFDFTLHRAQNQEQFLEGLRAFHPDIILADYRLPGFDGMRALALAREKASGIPFIFVSGEMGEELAIETLKQGATDYVLKQRLGRLVASVRRALVETRELLALKTAEHSLRVSEARRRDLFDSANDVIVVFDDEGNLLDVNRRAEELSRHPREQLLRMNVVRDLLAEDDRPVFLDVLRNLINGKQQFYSTRWKTRDGKDLFLEGTAAGEINERGEFGGFRNILRNVTERRRAEIELKRSEERYALAMAGINEGLWEWDLVTDQVYFSPRWKNIIGYSDKEIPNRREEWEKRIHPEDKNEALRLLRAHLDGKSEFYEVQFRMQHKDGTYRWILARGVCLRDSSGKPLRMAGSHSDITLRRNSELSLAEAEKKYRSIVENAPLGIFRTSLKGTILHANPKLCSILGFDSFEDFSRSVTDIAHDLYVFPEERQRVLALALSQQVPVVYETLFRRKDGVQIENRVHLQAVRNAAGEVLYLEGFIEDISERRKNEEMLRRSEEQFHSLFLNMVEGVAVHDVIFDETGHPVNYRVVEVNPQYERILSFPRAGVVGKLATEIYGTPNPPYLKEYSQVALSRVAKHMEIYFKPMDRHFEVSVAPWGGSGFATIFNDITERKRAEEKIRAALEEKEVLLKEVHHRVKNNLQFISSLLKLQSRFIRNKSLQAVFQQTQARIQTISLVHEKLYQYTSLSHIDFKQYVAELTSYFYRAYGMPSHNPEIRTHVEEMALDISRAISCGLIINELVSNSFKHAFPKGKSGEIHLEFGFVPARDRLRLCVSDNGRGLPSRLDLGQSQSLGFQLVSKLAEQLEGAVTVDRDHAGAKVSVEFPVRPSGAS